MYPHPMFLYPGFDHYPGVNFVPGGTFPPAVRNDTSNIPFLPIEGKQSLANFIWVLYQAIIGEATAIDFYSKLLKDAPDGLHKEFIRHAYEDEQKHLQAFTRLYIHFTGQEPQYQFEPVRYASYQEGLLKAYKDELEAAEAYRDVQLSTTDALIKDTFFLAMTDEMEHASRFSFLYLTLQAPRPE
ncbi:ferritin family protein [Caldibacillus debilis]|jgi:rubrerythrin|uniref:Rubrerythrin n=2 Tax=Caldibacillus debilis TaxID=301148 RepID=A0A420VBW3_9BACI|nr:ferritin-like domain-containing protein [Caldibacillus debilis]KYD11227.1 hypothetical protein B4135_3342 [Caldibacillus debilis]RKO61082.1 Rubrerythrin [Caldibacillus debilis GB1]